MPTNMGTRTGAGRLKWHTPALRNHLHVARDYNQCFKWNSRLGGGGVAGYTVSSETTNIRKLERPHSSV